MPRFRERIKVAYQRPKGELFMSNVINMRNLLGCLSKYADTPVISSADLGAGLEDAARSADYLLVDIKNFGSQQFILREKMKLSLPFIVILHTVYDWFPVLCAIIPLLKEKDLVISPSAYTKGSFLRLAARNKVHIMPLCMDIEKIQSQVLNKPAEKKGNIISFMGRLSPDRGIDVLIECMPQVIFEVRDSRLSIIGPLSGHLLRDIPRSDYVGRLMRKVEDSSLQGKVIFHGFKPSPEKYRILSNSRVYVSAATHENFGIAVLEAMACGVPVITTDSNASRELLSCGGAGYTYGCFYGRDGKFCHDRRRLVSLIVKILKDRQLGLRMGRRAMSLALRYDYRCVMPEFVKLLSANKMRPGKGRFLSWDVLKDKRISDFRPLFNRVVFRYLDMFGLGRLSYGDIYSRNGLIDQNPNLSCFTGSGGDRVYVKLMEDANRDLFRHLCFY